MRVRDYNAFVRKTDRFRDQPYEKRREIALYGVVGEIGSLTSAMKKKLLGDTNWSYPNEEIEEEIGDVVWYGTSLAQIENQSKPINILAHDIKLLLEEVGAGDERALEIQRTLDPAKRDDFLRAASVFAQKQEMTFEDYQKLAFMTARTGERILLRVCIAVLDQLGAELLRQTLPPIEKELNKNLRDRPVNVVLGEIAWHVAAICSILGLSLNDVVAKNMAKVAFLYDDDERTPFHDEDCVPNEQFPRRFEVAFVSVKPVRRGGSQFEQSRMFIEGQEFGADLTDNRGEPDGYRFHDVFHLANIAHLSWSPVARDLMGRKRKGVDDVRGITQDGGRPQVVEEALVKIIHTEGEKIANEGKQGIKPIRLFPEPTLVSYRLLKMLRSLVSGLDVERNTLREWHRAIMDGASMYYQLCCEEQGTVTVDMNKRTISFTPEVFLKVRGSCVGMGAARADVSSVGDGHLVPEEIEWCRTNAVEPARLIAAKYAVLDSLGLPKQYTEALVCKLRDREISVKPRDHVRRAMWDIGAVAFQVAFDDNGSDVLCTAQAIADNKPLKA